MDVLQFVWVGWLVLMLVFLILEVLSLDFVFLMLAIGSVAGLGADLVGLPLWAQVIVAAFVSAALLLVIRPPLLRRLHRGEDLTPSGIDALVGLEGRVLSTVDADGGQVRLANGEVWTARADDARPVDAAPFEPGEPVRVIRIVGATALVAAAPVDSRDSRKEGAA